MWTDLKPGCKAGFSRRGSVPLGILYKPDAFTEKPRCSAFWAMTRRWFSVFCPLSLPRHHVERVGRLICCKRVRAGRRRQLLSAHIDLKHSDADLSAKAAEEFDQGGELNIGRSSFHPGNEALFGADPIGQLLLCETGFEALDFELFSDNENVALHLELISLRRAYGSEVLCNEIFEGGVKFNFLRFFLSIVVLRFLLESIE